MKIQHTRGIFLFFSIVVVLCYRGFKKMYEMVLCLNYRDSSGKKKKKSLKALCGFLPFNPDTCYFSFF